MKRIRPVSHQIQLMGETTYGHRCPRCGLSESAPTYEAAGEMMWAHFTVCPERKR